MIRLQWQCWHLASWPFLVCRSFFNPTRYSGITRDYVLANKLHAQVVLGHHNPADRAPYGVPFADNTATLSLMQFAIAAG